MESQVPLGIKQVQEMLAKLQAWEIEEGKLEKEFKFSSFKEANEFINKVASLAEESSHHPDIFWWYTKVKIILFTHRLNSLTTDDFSLAEKIDKI